MVHPSVKQAHRRQLYPADPLNTDREYVCLERGYCFDVTPSVQLVDQVQVKCGQSCLVFAQVQFLGSFWFDKRADFPLIWLCRL